MSRHQVTCINKSDRTSMHERIKSIGGPGWKMSLTDAIRHIESGEYEFYVNVGASTAKVIIAVSASGNKYLKTVADTTIKDNLLSLPNCP